MIAGVSMPTTEPTIRESWRDSSGRVCATGWLEGERHVIEVAGAGIFEFTARSGPTLRRAAPGATDAMLEDARDRIVMPLCMQVRGAELLHGSSVGTPHGAVVITAVSHTGKSTLAVALAARGHELRADDLTCFRTTPGGALHIPLPFRPSLRSDARDWFGPAFEKIAERARSHRPVPSPIAAIFVTCRRPEATPGEGRLNRLPPAAAFRALLPHAHVFTLQDPERTRSMMNSYLSLAESVPVFELHVPNGLEQLDRVAAMIESAVSRSRQAA